MCQQKRFLMHSRHQHSSTVFLYLFSNSYLPLFPTLYHHLLYFLRTLHAHYSLTWHLRFHCSQRPLWPSICTFCCLHFLTLILLHATLWNSPSIPQTFLPPISTHVTMPIFVQENA